MNPAIITLTTDLGTLDPYLASCKGRILQQIPNANIIDITHQIRPFNIAEAAFVLKNCFREFPPDTVHLVSVESAPAREMPAFLVVRIADQILLGRDNGVLSLLSEEPPESAVCLPDTMGALENGKFPLKDVLIPAACRLLNGEKPEDLGEAVGQIHLRSELKAVIKDSVIRGTVIHTDRFGNIVTNISKYDLHRFRHFETCSVHFSRTEYFDTISSGYDDVPEGEKVCFFGSAGLLEIAINRGNASQLLGIDPGHIILIEFT